MKTAALACSSAIPALLRQRSATRSYAAASLLMKAYQEGYHDETRTYRHTICRADRAQRQRTTEFT
ncbi:MAG TPA: hypothetical protein VIK39_17850, partial [Candidatus Angelobacter sp.]